MAKVIVQAKRNLFFGFDEEGKRVNFTKGEVYEVDESKVKHFEPGSFETIKEDDKGDDQKPGSKKTKGK